MQQPLKDQIRHVLQLQFYVFYLALHFIQEFIRNLVKVYILKEVNQPGKIRVSRIIFKHKLDPEEISKRQDFVTSHGNFADVSILDNPLWHLYCVEKDRVFFVLLPREISYYRLGNFPFMFVPVYEEAVAVAEVSKEDFLKLGEQFNKEKCPKTILFTNTARCGSTLMGKMLDRPGNTVCWGEAHSLCNLAIGLDEGIFTEQECKELLQATIACLRAHVLLDQIAILKTTSAEARLVRLCGDIPNLKHMFMFRKKGLPSVEKVVRRESFMVEILLKIYNYSPQMARFISMLQPAMEGHFVRKLKPDGLRGLSAIVYASPYSHYLKNQSLYSHPVVWYHDVIDNTSQTLTDLFKSLDIPVSCVQKAIDCKKEDSQKNSFLSWESLGHVKIPPMTEEDREELVRYAQVMGVPEDILDC